MVKVTAEPGRQIVEKPGVLFAGFLRLLHDGDDDDRRRNFLRDLDKRLVQLACDIEVRRTLRIERRTNNNGGDGSEKMAELHGHKETQ